MAYRLLNTFYKSIESGKNALAWDGLDKSGRNAMLELLIQNDANRPHLIICDSDRRVQELSVFLRSVLTLPVYTIFEQSHLPVEVLAKEEDEGDSLLAFNALANAEACVVLVHVMALLSFYPRPSYLKDGALTVSVGMEIEQEALMHKLHAMGYATEGICDEEGVFTHRGGIVDVYSASNEYPVRIEWFDDEIDSMRFFSPETQKSLENVNDVTLFPASVYYFSEDMQQRLTKAIMAERDDVLASVSKDGQTMLRERLGNVDQADARSSVLSYYAYLLEEYHASFFDYLSDNTSLYFDGIELCEGNLLRKHEELLNQLADLINHGYILPSKATSFLTPQEMASKLSGRKQYQLSEMDNAAHLFARADKIYYPAKANPLKAYPVNRFIEDIQSYQKDGYTLVFYNENLEALYLLENLLTEYALKYTYVNTFDEIDDEGQLVFYKKNLGFDCDFSKDRCIFMNANVFDVKEKKAASEKKKKKSQTLVIEDLTVGDYIVHENHGIGMYLGIEHIKTDSVEKDYILIQYKGADRLYVPIDQMHLVEKYVGQEGHRPKVNKLGGVEWEKSKKRIKKSIEDMADQLLEVHAKREAIPGFAFSPDDELMHAFENDFPYTETEDQIRAIKEVKADMERPHSMDRLICGDVGFGKTEVALRAAFKAVCDNKQVAVLVPTTILAMQHFETFEKRMEAYGINVALLTRFCTVKEQNKIFKDIEAHKIDIVVGTHKLLNKKLHFQDLGLLIIDEEQRFGVKHKEQLKGLQENIDVLTLSATPIPRTLYFSLTGMKDMSIVETPPSNRLPIQTYVVEEIPMVIEQAVRREILRGGQVFVVYNSVENLPKMKARYQELFPNQRILMGHGRMKEAELEDVILKFQNHEADILVCTTIIETGIDMPNVNTMIVHNADCFGMAQLYQLKGRVGRSKRIAYAYLMYKKDKLLSEEQRKRLNTLREYTALGSGYKISMRDLEIRGSGNMLGAEQSGHVAEIGFELYLKMLQDAVRKMKRKANPEEAEALPPVHTEIDIDARAFFPETYIPDTRMRIGLYQRLDGLTSEAEIGDMYDELMDRFGAPEESVLTLLDLTSLKVLASDCRILSIKQKKDNVYIKIDPEMDFDIQALMAYIAQSLGKLMLKNIDDATYVVMDLNKFYSKENNIERIKRVVTEIRNIVANENV